MDTQSPMNNGRFYLHLLSSLEVEIIPPELNQEILDIVKQLNVSAGEVIPALA